MIQGDSGGPLFIDTALNHNVLYGITSFGAGCAKGPGVYAKINTPFTLAWIQKTVEENFGKFCYDPIAEKPENVAKIEYFKKFV